MVSVDATEHLGVQVSADKSGLIKVWNQMRVLVREIKFQEDVTSVAFVNNKPDLVVGHGGKLSIIAQPDYIHLPDLLCTQDQLASFYSQQVPLSNAYLEELKNGRMVKDKKQQPPHLAAAKNHRSNEASGFCETAF